MFAPPRCPNPRCPRHRHPRSGFYVHNGTYHPKCRAHPVPRFVCRTCNKGFSRQTFRADYRDHRPDLNAVVFLLLASGLGLRQTARFTGLSLRCTELKFRKIAQHLRDLNRNSGGDLPPEAAFQLDEFETYVIPEVWMMQTYAHSLLGTRISEKAEQDLTVVTRKD